MLSILFTYYKVEFIFTTKKNNNFKNQQSQWDNTKFRGTKTNAYADDSGEDLIVRLCMRLSVHHLISPG